MTTKSEQISSAKELGRMAFCCGQKLNDNIFVNGSSLRRAWKDGFIGASTARSAMISNKQGEENVSK
jgi:hypothetical protein